MTVPLVDITIRNLTPDDARRIIDRSPIFCSIVCKQQEETPGDVARRLLAETINGIDATLYRDLLRRIASIISLERIRSIPSDTPPMTTADDIIGDAAGRDPGLMSSRIIALRDAIAAAIVAEREKKAAKVNPVDASLDSKATAVALLTDWLGTLDTTDRIHISQTAINDLRERIAAAVREAHRG